MTVDIRGVNSHNKGALLMLRAIVERLGGRVPLSASPNGLDYDTRARLGLRQTMVLNQAPRASTRLGRLVPRSLADSYGLVPAARLTGVLDAAGFAYSDSFSSDRARREARLARMRRGRAPFVLLPQAFGPFTRPDQVTWSGQLIAQADVVFARDAASFEHVRRLVPRADIRIAPDFTIGLKPTDVPRRIPHAYAALVPNQKMITHTGLTEPEYIAVLVAAGRTFRAHGREPVVVIHEFNDLEIGRRVAEELDGETFVDADPLVLKRVLGDADFAMASRFHAIVGALSQGTPVIAFGWSHKYEMLLQDFGVPQWTMTDAEAPAARIEAMIADDAALVTLAEAGAALRARNETMWAEVESRLRVP